MEAYSELNSLFSMSKGEIEKEFCPYFYQYYKEFIFENPTLKYDRLEAYLHHCQSLFTLAQAKCKKVLDVGSGFGLMSIFFALLGAKEVTGVDIDEEKISTFRKILSRLKLGNVRAELGDGLKLDRKDAIFDVVVANEVVSHVRELEPFFQEMSRVLRRNGVFVIRDGNNALNASIVSERKQFWERCERGPVAGTSLEKPYVKMREDLIRAKFPEISEKEIRAFAKKTRGFWGNELLAVVEELLKTACISKKPDFEYRNPITGEIPERLLNPFELKRQLMELGFLKVEIYPHLPIRTDRSLVRRLLKPLYPFLLYYRSKSFDLVARKGK